jgi:catechol 2,3-dioxygenase-like lactoylglutathione lyase family enzyme
MAFAHATLATRDVVATSRFFKATLGWEVIARPNNIAMPAAWLEIEPGVELHLVQVDDFEASPFEREYGRHLAVSYGRGEMDGLKERLRLHGAEVIAAERPTDFERFFFRTPDGYMFEVVAS